jgi:hypothetical protein
MGECELSKSGKCPVCNPEGKATTKTISIPKGVEDFTYYGTKPGGWKAPKPGEIKIDWEAIAPKKPMEIKGTWVDAVNIPEFPVAPGTKVPKKPAVEEPEGGGILDLPSPEDWVKKYFPKGSTVLGPARDLRGFQSQVFRRAEGTEENVSPRQKGRGQCWACSPDRRPHVLPKRQRCPCGCIWSNHYGHICNKCDTECYPVLTLTGYWVSLPDDVIFGTAEGCTCSYCRYRGQKRGVGQTTIRLGSRPPAKPTSGARCNLGAEDYGLDPKLILVEAAANFYLLVEMGAMEPLAGELDEKFRGVTARLADQLCLYLELACLGEFRYTGECISPFYTQSIWFPDNPHLQLKEVKVQKRKRLATKRLMKDLRDAISTIVEGRGSKNDERMAAWSTWETLYEKYGDKIYQLMIYGFKEATWGRSSTETAVTIGGPKWAVCVEAVQAYRKGMPSVVFVDQALSLKHNGNIAFNKFFDVSGLDWVINWAFKGATVEIQHYATDDIRKTWQAWREEREGGRDEQKQKQQEQEQEQAE